MAADATQSRKRGGGLLKGALIAAAVLFGLFLLMVAYGSTLPERRPSEAIQEECQRQFSGQGEDAVSRCRVALMVRRIEDDQAQRLKDADAASRR